MNKVNEGQLDRIKYRLTGRRFVRLLKDKKVKKYEIHKALGLSYRTLSMWQSEKAVPSDVLAIKVAIYLGLIKPEAETLFELKKELDRLLKRIKLIEGGESGERLECESVKER